MQDRRPTSKVKEPKVVASDHALAYKRCVAANLYDHPDLYDLLLPVGTHLPFYVDLARQQAGPVLELACGTGQLTIPIAQTGLITAGVDQSTAMLDRARARASAANVLVDFVHADMRNFDVGRQFSFVFVARNSLLHLHSTQELRSVFAAVKRHLAPRGLFVFDVFNPDVRLLARTPGHRFPVMEVTETPLGNLSVEGTHDYDPAAQVDHGTWFVSVSGHRDALVFPLSIRSIFPQELPLLVSACGFELIDRFGDVSREPFGPQSPRQICVCRAAR